MRFQKLLNAEVREPKFTEQGLILPGEYYNSWVTYHNRIVEELERRNFAEFIRRSEAEGIAPSIGYQEWIKDASIYTWVLSLKAGYTTREFFPTQVARNILNVSSEMLIDLLFARLLDEEDDDNITKH